jgi:hypothetical protein
VQGAEVLIDGASNGTIPRAPIRLRAGAYTLEIRLEGFYPLTRQIVVNADQVTLEVVELRPQAAPPVNASSAPPGAKPSSRASSREPVDQRDRNRRPRSIAQTG